MISGNLTDEIRDECIKLGATDYLTKPVQMAELKAVLRHHASPQESMQRGIRPAREVNQRDKDFLIGVGLCAFYRRRSSSKPT
jgi:DNA-binding response OmpR family regulator